jgi:hypothetical protein
MIPDGQVEITHQTGKSDPLPSEARPPCAQADISLLFDSQHVYTLPKRVTLETDHQDLQ